MQKPYNMITIDLRDFCGGKIFNDQFTVLLASDHSLHYVGAEVKVTFRGSDLGTGVIAGLRRIDEFHIYDKKFIANSCNQKKYDVNSKNGYSDQIIFKYSERNLATHADLMEEWWNGVKTSQQILQP